VKNSAVAFLADRTDTQYNRLLASSCHLSVDSVRLYAVRSAITATAELLVDRS